MVHVTFITFSQKSKKEIQNDFVSPAASFDHFTIEEGSPSNNIRCVYRDNNGFVWFGTDLGLVRFDGYDFKVFTNDKSDSNSISTNEVTDITPDKEGNLWISTEKYLNFFNIKNESFKKHVFYNEKGEEENGNGRFFMDSRSNIWLGIGDYTGNYNPVKSEFKKFIHNPNDSSSIGSKGLMNIAEDENGDIWLTTYNQGLSKFNKNTNNFTNFKYNKNYPFGIPDSPIWSITPDKKGNLYLAYYLLNDAIGKFDIKTGKHTLIKNPLFSRITRMAVDNKSNVWIGSVQTGLLKYNPNDNKVTQFRHEPNNPESITETRIDRLFIDKDNNLWAGSLNKGLNKLNLNYSSVNLFTLPLVDNKNPKIFQIWEDKTKNLWICTDKGLFIVYYSNKNIVRIQTPNANSVDKAIERICYANDGNLWAQGSNTVYVVNPLTLKSYNLNHPLSKELITNSYTDKNKGFWLVNFFEAKYYKNGNINLKPLVTLKGGNSQDKYAHTSFIEEDSLLYINVENIVYKVNKYNVTDTSNIKDPFQYRRRKSSVYKRNNKLYAFSDAAVYNVSDENKTKFEEVKIDFLNHSEVTPIGYFYDDNNICFSTFRGIFLYNIETKAFYHPNVFNQNKIDPDIFFKASDGTFYLGAGDGFISFNPKELEFKNEHYNNIALVDFYLFNKPANVGQEDSPLKQSITFAKEVNLTHEQSVFSFEMSLLNIDEPKLNDYAYKLEGYDKDWNYIGHRKVATYTNLPAGEYIFKYTACNKNGVWAKTKEIKVIILPPFWETWWFRIISIITICSGVFGFFQYRTQRIRKHNEELETQVKHRTAEIMSQNEEILAQKEEIERQEAQIHELYNDVTDSIQTAQRIQESILPPENLINECVSEAFVLYIPKDIVSGDFYWIHTDVDYTYIAAVDCTGHGVAGAFMSLIGYNLLVRIMKEETNPSPSLILTKLNTYVIQVLNQENENAISKEGMEISLCMINKKTKEVTFTGANNKLYIARNNTIEIINGDINPVGIMPLGKTAKFTDKVIKAEEGDIFYIFSDGFAGQFGGDSGNDKLKYPRFREYLLDIHSLPISEQKMALLKKFNNWKREALQTDDIMVIGFQV
ncbi:MAG: two-component regulator propeller domain-containing protein [Bacteroidota bacterium]|nr:two-component regulator propeller domain-containing protein [Bacteroidota bacterium]